MNHHGRQFSVTLAAGMATFVSSYAIAQSHGGYTDNRAHTVQRPQDASAEQNRPETPKAAQDRIHPDVYTKLQSSDDETIYVLVTLKAEIKEGTTPEQKKASIKKVQDKLLAKLAPRELDLVYQFETPGLLIARIDAAILTKLEDYPDVTGVIPSKIAVGVFAELGSSDDDRVHVIVRLTRTEIEQTPPTSEQRKKLVKEIQDRVFRNLAPGELKIRWRFEISGGFSGHINAAGLAKLAIHPDVVGVGVVGRGTVDLDQSVPFIKADQVHKLGYTGAWVTVAVLDSGVDCTHPELQGRCADGAASFIGGQSSGGAEDDYGHGTYMAAIIAGLHPGVAPDAQTSPDQDRQRHRQLFRR